MRLLLALLIATLAGPALADQYSCQTVDRSAVAYVNTNVIVSKLETNRRCVLSVDGATATGGRASAFVGAVNNLVYELFESEYYGSIDAGMLVDMFTAPFGPESNNPEGQQLVDDVAQRLTPEDNKALEDCLNSFADMLGPQFEYHEVQDIGVYETRQVYCHVVMPPGDIVPEPGWTVMRDGALHLEFRFDDTVLGLSLPTNFLIDARDGNGIFN